MRPDTSETQLNPTTASGGRNGAERRVTHTGLEFREQWSTIISGRKSSLNEAIFTKLSLFSVRITRLTGQGDQGKLQVGHLYSPGTNGGGADDQNRALQEADPHGSPIHGSTEDS